MNIMIIISTQTTKQHYIVDSFVSIVLVETTYWLFKNSKLSLWIEKIFTRFNTKLNIDWDGIIR